MLLVLTLVGWVPPRHNEYNDGCKNACFGDTDYNDDCNDCPSDDCTVCCNCSLRVGMQGCRIVGL